MPADLALAATRRRGGTRHDGKAVLVFNVAALAISLVALRMVATRILALPLPDLLSLWGLASAGIITFVTTMIPKPTRMRAMARTRALLKTRAVAIGCAGLLAVSLGLCGMARHEVTWSGADALTVDINGTPRTLTPATREGPINRALIRWYAFVPLRLDVGTFSADLRSLPLGVRTIAVPLHASHGNDQIAYLETLLLRAFYQYQEGQQLEGMQNALNGVSGLRPSDALQVARLRALLRTAREIFVGKDMQRVQVLLIEFRRTYPGDPWQPLLDAGGAYAAQRFDQCWRRLDGSTARPLRGDDLDATERFFQGSCLVKDAAGATRSRKPMLLNRARADFAAVETDFARRGNGSGLTPIALPSAIVFQGITHFYLGDFERAMATFSRGFDIGEPVLRARAFNGAGFVRLVQGRVDEAGDLFNDALRTFPDFPYARSNYGFTLLAQGDFARARLYFQANKDDPVLQRTSQRDVILADLSLIHVRDLQGEPLTTLDDAYAAFSRRQGGNGWDSIADPSVRYGYLARELTGRVYLNGRYYGLEMFAMNYLCRARAKLAGASGAREAPALTRELDTQIHALRRMVHPAWLREARQGWFESLHTC